MNKLREEALLLISETRTDRPAVLRRSMLPDALYCTDLPQAAKTEAVTDFCRRAEKAGWRTKTENGWIQMDLIPDEPPAEGFSGPWGIQAECCASLLKRHCGGQRPDGKRERRMLLKAGEEGSDAYEKTCGQLHREWAEALRKGKTLPQVHIGFFNGGDNK